MHIKHGKGTLVCGNDRPRYEGFWKDDKEDGLGE